MLVKIDSTDFEIKKQSDGRPQSLFKHEEFGYCTEFILRLASEKDLKAQEKKPFNKKRIDAVLNAHGNSIVSVHDDDLFKVHIHTKNPGHILTYAQQFGEFVKIKVENMSEQHSELIAESQNGEETEATIDVKNIPEEKKERSKFALIAVANGEGIKKAFIESGCTDLISGGQTMNPSTDDFVKAIKDANADVCFVFPNNSNIIMAAKQAAEVLKDESNVIVIPTKSIQAGLCSAMFFNPESSVEENTEDMTECLEDIKTGEITYSIRDVEIDHVKVHKGDFMSISGKKIFGSFKTKFEALDKLIKKLIDDGTSTVSIFYGLDVDKALLEQVEKLKAKYAKKDIEIEVKNGGQAVYSFYVLVE